MIDFTDAVIEQLAVHRVGNKVREDNNFISESLTPVLAPIEELFLNYLNKSFMDYTETFHFSHDIDLSYNVMNGLTQKIFADPRNFYEHSIEILKQLYEQSNHQNIKSGDIFVFELTGLLYNNQDINAIGIFKSENKEHFIKLVENQKNINLLRDVGINIKKIDKACLILNTEAEDGYRVLSIDNNKYDADYWKLEFLKIDYIKDNNFNTKNYLNLCKSFATEVIAENAGKKEQIDFLNQTIKYFDKNEKINIEEFSSSLFENQETKNAFNSYKKRFEDENDVEIADDFELSKTVYKKQKRSFKNLIKLDTNIQIKLDFNNPESSEKFVEKGYDDKKEMYFYKVYFNKEM